MTIVVTRPGILYENRFFTLTCRSCRSELRFQGMDVVEGRSSGVRSVLCPFCETENAASLFRDEPLP